MSGVFLRIAFASLITTSANSLKSSVSLAHATAFSAVTFATVRIVPSLGFITALYAVSTAFLNPAAAVSVVRTSSPLTPL